MTGAPYRGTLVRNRRTGETRIIRGGHHRRIRLGIPARPGYQIIALGRLLRDWDRVS